MDVIVCMILTAIFFLALFYLWAIKSARPRTHTAPFLGVCYAHRGFHNLKEGIPENSLPAFRAAVARGYGIELDVQVTKDGQVVVFHDDLLSRVCGIDLLLREKTYEELTALSLYFTDEKIPLLSQVLKLVDGRVPLLIELKVPLTGQRTCALVNDVLKDYKGPYCIESFNTFALFWYRRHRPDVVRGQLSCNLTKTNGCSYILSFLTKYLLGNFLGRPDFISYCYLDRSNISLRLVRRLYKAPALAWTVESERAYSYAKKYFEGIIFEGFAAKNLTADEKAAIPAETLRFS